MNIKKIQNNNLLALTTCPKSDKTSFVAHIARNLAPHDTELFADYISQLPFFLVNEAVDQYIITKAEWVNLLAEHQLQLLEYIDASQEIIHILDDPESTNSILSIIAPNLADDFNCWPQLRQLLQRKLISFALFKIKKSNDLSIEKLQQLNSTISDLPLTYREATNTEHLFYEINWENLPKPLTDNHVSKPQIWLIIAKYEHKPFVEMLKIQLKPHASRIIIFYTKDNFNHENDDVFYLNPNQLQHWKHCFKAIRKLDIRQILYLQAWDETKISPESDNFHENIKQQCLQLTYFCQAYSQANLYTVPKLWLITAGNAFNRVRTEDNASEPSIGESFNHSLLFSLLRKWLAEHSSRNCTALDLDLSCDNQSRVEALISILINGTTEPQIALRSSGNKVPRLNRLAAPLSNKPLNFKNNASCLIVNSEHMLITGVVAWLIKQNLTHFILIDHEPLHLAAQNIIDQLSQNGITIYRTQFDPTKPDQLATALQEVAGNLPPIRYSIYSAHNFNLEKIPEIITLHQLTQTLPLDYFITFSSLNSQLATAENALMSAFLNTLANYRQQSGLPALNIHWSPWSAIVPPEAFPQQLLLGFHPITDLQIGAVLTSALCIPRTNLTLANINWTRYQNSPEARDNQKFISQLLTSEVGSSHQSTPSSPIPGSIPESSSRKTKLPPPCGLDSNFLAGTTAIEELATGSLNRLSAIERIIIQHVQAVSDIDHNHSFDVNRSYSNLGLDSVMLLDLHQRIQQEFGSKLSIPKTILASYPSISELTYYLDKKIPSKENSDSKKIIPLKSPQDTRKDIAIIGISGRFPGANNVNEFWENLRDGKASITEIPKERWSVKDFYDPDPSKPDKTHSKWGGFLNNIDQFDAGFFQIIPLEASSMDPQQRLFLQEAWRAFEAAGYSDVSLEKMNCGVYVGLGLNNEYQALIDDNADNDLCKYQFTGNHSSILAARIAYHLNLKGPVIAFDTGCSSSLVAIHLACQALQNPEVDMMLAGGVTLLLTEKPFIMMSNAGILAPDGKCKTFDDAANGIVVGEGVGVAVLKRLEDAIADRDPILGIIKASGINQDGKTSGITVPSTQAQHDLHKAIYQASGINPNTISYFEAHGTGTKLGDPIEFRALQQTFAGENEKQFCALGSAKTNIGHTVAAAGIAGLIKVLLCMQNKALVPSLNFNNPNQHIDFKNSPFFVNTELRSWQTKSGKPRRAAINSFSINGTNAHLVVEEAPPSANTHSIIKPYYLICLSAKTQTALRQKIKDLLDWCIDSTAALVDISFTLLVGRSHFKWRCGWIVHSTSELKTILTQIVQENFSISENYIEQEIIPSVPDLEEQLSETIQIALKTDYRQHEEYHAHLATLLNLYLQGAKGNWEFLYEVEMPQRIFLPTYSFDSHHYWLLKKSQLELSLVPKNPYARNTSMNTPRQYSLLAEIKTLLADLIHIEETELNPDTPFLEMGADSIVLLSAIHQIEHKYKVKVSVQQLFEQCNTLRLLANYLHEKLPEPINLPALPLKSTASCELSSGLHATTTSQLNPSATQQSQSHPTIQAATPSLLQQTTAHNPTSISTIAKSSLEQLISQQLTVMTQQLQLLQQPNLISAVNRDISANNLELEPAKSCASSPNPATSQITSWQHRKVDTAAQSLSLRQQQHIQALTKRFCARTKLSKQYAQQYRALLADSKASVGFRFSIKEMLYPIVGKRTQGARLWDIDGNEYIDITMGFGVHLFGYQPDFLIQAMQAQVQQGIQIGPRSPLVGEVAQLFTELTGLERVAFANSGTEAVMTALRLARAKTGRTRYVIFKNSYHGHADFSLVEAQIAHADGTASPLTPGIPQSALTEALVLDYGDMSALAQIQQQGIELAAVIVEPIQSRHPSLQPKAFLEQLRDITKQFGIALIFDEMLTGFRLHAGGAQAFFGVRADLATYGKIVGGGMPIGIIAGSREFMDSVDGGFWQYGDNSYPETERTFFGGTFCQHAFTLATMHAVLKQLKQQGPELQQQLNQKTANLAQELNDFFGEQQAPIRVVYWGSLFKFDFTQNLDLLFYHLLEKGIYVWEWRNCFLSTAHTDSDIAYIIQAVKESIFELQQGGFLPEPPPGASRDVSAASPPSCALNYWDRHTSKPSLTNRGTSKDSPITMQKLNGAEPVNLDFSISYFGHYDCEYHAEKYDLILQSIKYADTHGFKAAWIPERHFHPFGGFSPNPSVLCAALARETQHIALRAGSVVLPLHHPVRIAEEWAVVDNLSNGRVGIAFASGWHPQDFIFQPQAYGQHRKQTFEQIAGIKQLWRGENLQLPGGDGKPVTVKLFPMPKQTELPIWITVVNNPETYIKAGEIGAGILTNLMGQTITDLSHNIALYRHALADNGHPPHQGQVTVLLHAFLDDDLETARNIARQPFCNYLKTTLSLLKNLVQMQGLQVDIEQLNAEDLEYLLTKVYQGYVQSSALIGTIDSCARVIEHLITVGVDEIACFIDFGIEKELVLNSLRLLSQLKDRYQHLKKSSTDRQGLLSAAPIEAPLSKAQQQLYTLSQLGENNAGSLAYHIFVDVELKGEVNIPALHTAIHQIITRHEALRTTIIRHGECQAIQPVLMIEIPIIDFSKEDPQDQQEKMTRWLNQDRLQNFDLAQGPLLRIHLLKITKQHHLLSIVTHHIVMDGHSMSLFLHELSSIYNAHCQNTEAQLITPFQFREYLQMANSVDRKNNQAYWLKRLEGIPNFLELPANLPRPAYRIHKAASKNQLLSTSLSQALKKLARLKGCTAFILMIAAYSAFLARITQQYKFILGVPNHGRESKSVNNMLGYTANLLPLTFQIDDELSFADYLKNTRTDLLEGYTHQDFLFSELIESFSNDPNFFPLGNVHFNMERMLSIPESNLLNWQWLPRSPAFIDQDLFFNIYEMENTFLLWVDYSSELFYTETIDSLLESFLVFLESIVLNSDQIIKNIPLINQETTDILLNQYNPNKNAIQANQSLPDIFYNQAKHHPEAIAVTDAKNQLTYQQLNEVSNQLAHYICGVLPNYYDTIPDELFIGIYMHGSVEAIISMLAIVKAGYAYVPLDPTNPVERLSFIIDDANIKLILAIDCFKSKISALKTNLFQVLYVDSDREKFSSYSIENLPNKVSPNQLAYAIYTSGSTGNPKGVMIEHASIIRLLFEVRTINQTDKIALILNIAFDGSVTDIWGSLSNGAELILSDFSRELNVEDFSVFLEKNKISILTLTPAVFEFCLAQSPNIFKNIRYLWLGGDVIKPEVINLLPADPSYRPNFIVNVYGPTENTVATSTYYVPNIIHQTSIAIGKPVNNTTVYLLDQNLQLLPPGMIAELYAGGIGLARGYLNNPSLTKEKFINNPWDSGRLYKTGDRARWLADGNLEFLGRIDTQVKVNGFRIELEEIENALLKHSAISQAAVITVELNNSKIIAAFFVLKNQNFEPTLTILHEHLNRLLPAYMLPSKFIKLNQLPITGNGKLDRHCLQHQVSKIAENSSGDDELEDKLLSFWQNVLNVTPSTCDSFFISGGNSLLAAKLLATINQHFDLNLPLSFIFSNTSIQQQAQQIRLLQLENNARQACLSFNPQGTLLPLFFIHPAQVGAEAYYQMGKLFNPDQPFYALDSYNLQHEVHLDSIEKMAKHYRQIIQNIQPKGPYYLGGWSLGGLIAYELALQLTALGQEVLAVYLIDSFLFDTQFQQAANPCQVFMDFHNINSQILSLPAPMQEKANKVLAIEIAAAINYSPEHRFNGNVQLFKATEICPTALSLPNYLDELRNEPFNGWHKLLGVIQVHNLEGNHQTIMQGECLRYIVKIISELSTTSKPLETLCRTQ